MNISLCENIDWVGYVDWAVRDFHGYSTDRGATYNSYLVRDQKTALIDTVKEPFVSDLLKHVSDLTDLSGIKYVICNHAEPDHAGGLSKVLEALPDATLVCNEKCRKTLALHHDTEGWKFQIIKTGDSLSLGKRTLTFIDTPMVHWPESMFTYVPEEKILFSMDAFGQHYATSKRFDDEISLPLAMEEARSYYANIVMPFGGRVQAVLKQAAGLEIQMIAPSHGVIWRSHAAEIVEAYTRWAVCRPEPKLLVVFDTMWNSTGEMAKAIHEGALIDGLDARLIDIRRSNLTVLATEVLDAAAIAFGSSTLNQGILPMAGAVLGYWKGLRPQNKAAFAFGSYGWGKGGPEAVEEAMQAMKWEIVREPIRAQFRPTAEILEACRTAGRELALEAIKRAALAKGNK